MITAYDPCNMYRPRSYSIADKQSTFHIWQDSHIYAGSDSHNAGLWTRSFPPPNQLEKDPNFTTDLVSIEMHDRVDTQQWIGCNNESCIVSYDGHSLLPQNTLSICSPTKQPTSSVYDSISTLPILCESNHSPACQYQKTKTMDQHDFYESTPCNRINSAVSGIANIKDDQSQWFILPHSFQLRQSGSSPVTWSASTYYCDIAEQTYHSYAPNIVYHSLSVEQCVYSTNDQLRKNDHATLCHNCSDNLCSYAISDYTNELTTGHLNLSPSETSTASKKRPLMLPRAHKNHNACFICSRMYARPSTLKTHLRTHAGLRPYQCICCAKRFSQAANLTAHLRTHSGERPFQCQICLRRFSQSSSVTTHMRTHSGERPYTCVVCSKAFSDSSTLTKHVRVHSGERPYACSQCDMSFSQAGNMKRHLRVHDK